MEMEQLANKLVELNCHTAINLDGGRSSRLMWRNRGERVINQAGPTMSEAYPLGSIISFVKKK
jgi:exopolysaccharide biosynthesis protein